MPTEPSKSAMRASNQLVQKRARQLRGDLDHIVLKALHPQASSRYASAAEFAADLRRYSTDFPVQAQPDSVSYRVHKFVGRHKAAVAFASVSVLGLFAALLVSLDQTKVASDQRRVAEQALLQAQQDSEKAASTNAFLVSLLESGDPSWYVDRASKGPQTPMIDVVLEASARLDSDLETDPLALADLHHILGNTLRTFSETSLRSDAAVRAKHHFQSALRLRQEHLGEAHPDVARSWYYLATLQSPLTERLRCLEKSIEVEMRLSTTSSNYPYAVLDAAETAARLGLTSRASQLLGVGNDLLVAGALEQDHPLRLQALTVQAQVAVLGADLDAAETVLERHQTLAAGNRFATRLNFSRRGFIARHRGDHAAAWRWAQAERDLLGTAEESAREPGGGIEAFVLLGLLALEDETPEAESLRACAQSAQVPAWPIEPLSLLQAQVSPERCLEYNKVLLERSSQPTTPSEGELQLALGVCLKPHRAHSAQAMEHLQRSRAIFAELFGEVSPMVSKVDEVVGKSGQAANSRSSKRERR